MTKMSIAIAVTRFDNKTQKENMKWRNDNNYEGCIYGVSQMISANVKEGINIMIIEMNINTNTIIGIGYIKNEVMKRKKIYSNGNYNRFIYKGTLRIDKEQLNNYKQIDISQLELQLFYGITHFKRGTGITIINKNKLQNIETIKLSKNPNADDLINELSKIKLLHTKAIKKKECNTNTLNDTKTITNSMINQLLYSKDIITVEIQTKNPKRKASESYKRYEKYKTATTLPMMLSLGGTKLDILYDIKKGYVTFNNNYTLNR